MGDNLLVLFSIIILLVAITHTVGYFMKTNNLQFPKIIMTQHTRDGLLVKYLFKTGLLNEKSVEVVEDEEH
jgi:hypothetical protein